MSSCASVKTRREKPGTQAFARRSRQHHLRWLGALSLLWLLGLPGCKEGTANPGGLVVVVESDLSLPKDIDRIRVEVSQSGKMLFSAERKVGAGELLIPAEFRVDATGNDKPVLVRGLAFLGDKARIERSAITPIPNSRLVMLRLPLGFLCDGTANSDGGSTCGDEQTCKLGECTSALLTELPAYSEGPWTAAPSGEPAGGRCFDVHACFASHALPAIDPDCSAPLPEGVSPERLNVAIQLPLGSDGICSAGVCWVPLDEGSEGWNVHDTRIQLPASLCRERKGERLTLAVSTACPTKTNSLPPCGSWSSAMSPVEALGTQKNPFRDGAPTAPLGVEACEGSASEACGDCGTRTRSCRNGRWLEWSLCTGERMCAPSSSQACGSDGSQTCNSDCTWMDCAGQSCMGPAVRACGNCGTQRRSCGNGAWSEWSACSDSGACVPGDAQSCGANGMQACGGNCQWGACGDQACAGAPSQACGHCGSQTRTCDSASATWSDWSACTSEGACAPNDTRNCGASGSQTCAGNCQWDAACAGQTCSGPRTQACGNCGVQSRSCDDSTGEWSAWSACSSEGACAANSTSSCGAGGTQNCGTNCQWGACLGQVCAGSAAQACGDCGTQTRTCDRNTAQWSAWSTCTGQGACAPDATRSCGAGGTQVCGNDCLWGAACSGQSCPGASTQTCGRCGVQTRNCDASSGQWSAWEACSNEGACTPDTTRGCGAGGTQICGSDCRWGTACTGQVCSGSATQACGNCGMQSRSCDANTGQWSGWSACSGEGECMPTATEVCAGGGARTCNTKCAWGPCGCPSGQMACRSGCVNLQTDSANCGQCDNVCPGPTAGQGEATCVGAKCGLACKTPPDACGSMCVDLQTDRSNCGQCGMACSGGVGCQAGKCTCGQGTHDCDGSCVKDASPATCGMSCTPCPGPTAGQGTPTCDGRTCDIACAQGLTLCGTACVDLQSNNANCGRCGNSCLANPTAVLQCRAGACVVVGATG
jgi:hypothetical protein